jgi:superfamily II DNA/RNA helicase
VLVFTRTKHGADKVVRSLQKSQIAAEAIHGNKSQNQRERVLGAFRAGTLRTLVATDIAARGIDVDGISHVINFDLPNIPESYVHRIGRTARAGADGIAISFCDNEEMPFLRDIEKLIQIKLPVTERRRAPHADAAPRHRPQQARNGNRNGQHNGHRAGGGNGQRNGGRPGHNGQQQRRQQHGRQEQGRQELGRHGQQPRRQDNRPVVASAPDNIATVGFMRAPEPRRTPGDAGRHTR